MCYKFRLSISASLEVAIPKRIPSHEGAKDIAGLLAQTPIVRSPCDLDLLVFLYRHPRSLLKSEQVAEFVGHDIKDIAKSLEAFIDAGLLERTQHPAHAARLYLLMLDGPEHEGLMALLRLASTREGRQNVVRLLTRKDLGAAPNAPNKHMLRIA